MPSQSPEAIPLPLPPFPSPSPPYPLPLLSMLAWLSIAADEAHLDRNPRARTPFAPPSILHSRLPLQRSFGSRRLQVGHDRARCAPLPCPLCWRRGWALGGYDAPHLARDARSIIICRPDDGDAVICLLSSCACSTWLHQAQARAVHKRDRNAGAVLTGAHLLLSPALLPLNPPSSLYWRDAADAGACSNVDIVLSHLPLSSRAPCRLVSWCSMRRSRC